MVTSSLAGSATRITRVLSRPTREPSASIAATLEFFGYLLAACLAAPSRSEM
jgi:hypothetical protein